MSYAGQIEIPCLSVDSDPDLVRRAQARDAPAFGQLYQAHVRRIYALCLRMTADASRAEELTQQAFVCAWEKLPFFRGDSAFSSWLHRLTVNIVLMELRAGARRAARVLFTDDPAALEIARPVS